jgi:hypothetical protein
MEPELPNLHPRATLADLLDRVLDKGLVIKADVIICVTGIPLIGLTLSVGLAGMETMLKYGIMSDWDRAIRAGPKRAIATARRGPVPGAATPMSFGPGSHRQEAGASSGRGSSPLTPAG